MQLNRLLGYFHQWPPAVARQRPTLKFSDHGTFALYGGLRLDSVFQPIMQRQGGGLRPVAHEALLRVSDKAGQPLAVEHFFAQAGCAEEFVYLDRLSRVIHALNFAAQAEPGELLFLNVHGQHLLSIASGRHGSTFETLLGYCGLQAQQVVLEIVESEIADLQLLDAAIHSYKRKGFRIAIDDFGAGHSNFDRLWQLTPDLVKLDRSLLTQPALNERARMVFPKLIDIIHDLGGQVVCEGIETEAQHRMAWHGRAGLICCRVFTTPDPQPACITPG
ncbi:EAL domain-containing protein [Aquitalea magnusonii]|uniref:EAL domain-containing protein (Putative c-di-GMP-specific phosphodiesterase class I) n=1 Tax=Aquitalea magnusonii TaxID=332411 RepID=A0A318JQQ7_9NEIS|nr:EAL domain-containing protein [Aquitalea magnusonii]PXX50987.1 EAL domain-containing protein (putative c-di-GMP-specific phosphodiesterase class I) [Aquitalea magnusonii]